jgi:hypothetical protein
MIVVALDSQRPTPRERWLRLRVAATEARAVLSPLQVEHLGEWRQELEAFAVRRKHERSGGADAQAEHG